MLQEKKSAQKKTIQTNFNGHSFGNLTFGKTKMMLNQDGTRIFSINYQKIQNATTPAPEQVLIEFQQDQNLAHSHDVDTLCEMRIKTFSQKYKQNDNYEDDKKEHQIIVQELTQKAKLNNFSGTDIATFPMIQMVMPRGKYQMRFYNDSLHLHGSTHDTKTNYKHISRCYLLDYPGQTQKAFIVALNRAIRIGQTNYPYIVMKIKEQYSPEIKINLQEEEIKKNYGDNLLKAVNDGVLEGPLYHNLASLFSSIVHSKVITTGDHFRSFDNDHCVKCSVKAQEGLLYPLVKSFLFIHKPVVNIKHQEIKEVKFLRIASKQRTFDLQVICKGQGNQFEFTGIKKDEYEPFSNYLAQSSIKVSKQQQQARKSNKKSYAPEDQYIDYDDGEDESDDQDYQEGGDDDDDDDDQDDDDDEYDGDSNSQSNSQNKRQMKKK